MARPVYLVGGGWTASAAGAVYDPFVAECGGPIVLVVEAGPGSAAYARRFVEVLEAAGAAEVPVLEVAADRLPRREDFAGAAGVVVGGGLTPNYHALLVDAGRDWLPDAIPYLGFSAGAAIASRHALIGGCAIESSGVRRAVSPEETSEDLDAVAVAPGLGLVPWTVDVHAGQWGTLARLWHVVASGASEQGFAIDEDTCLVARGETWQVAGRGHVYELRRDEDGCHVRAHVAPAVSG
ncbi:MAG: cyanophycinase [Solirubrobacteraceae bacterium]|jgi:cyanophycinase|nr:cyanophycinase [Solirubrobacteraceae bacterium]